MEITAVVLWIVAFVFILITVSNLIKRAVKTKRCTAVTSGVISDIKEKVSNRDGVISREYIPTVVYTVDGVEYNTQYVKAYNAETYKTGQSVEVMYNPNKPNEINKKGKSNTPDLIMLGIGILIGVIGVVLLALS